MMKPFFLLIIVFICLQFLLGQFQSQKRQKILISPSKSIVYFSFGYEPSLASLMWVRMVQDFHVCDQQKEKVQYPEFRENMDPLEDILTRELPPSRCQEGWVYQMLDVISDLQPQFRSVYADGATMLSVIVDDREGAQKIYHKGLIAFPEDWDILFRAAYHEMFEMQNAQGSQELMLRAAQAGAPQWVYALYGKLMDRTGQAALALGVLQQVLDRDLGGDFRGRIEAQVERLKETLRQSQQPQ
jgi:hypothetical protein